MNERDILNLVVKSRLNRNQNWLCLITGDTGTGKSYTSLEIGTLLDPDFSVERVVFDIKELLHLIRESKPKQILVMDEAGIQFASRDFSTKKNRIIGGIFQAFRFKQLGLMWTLPDTSMIDIQARRLMHSFLETLPVDYINQRTRVKWFEVRVNRWTGEYRHEYLRIYDKERKRPSVIKVVSFAKPPNKLIDEYEKKKREAFDDVLDSAFRILEGDEGKRGDTEEEKEEVEEVVNEGSQVDDDDGVEWRVSVET